MLLQAKFRLRTGNRSSWLRLAIDFWRSAFVSLTVKWMVELLSTDIGRRDLTARAIWHMDGTDACALHASGSCALHAEASLDSLRRLAPESERQVLVCEAAVA